MTLKHRDNPLDTPLDQELPELHHSLVEYKIGRKWADENLNPRIRDEFMNAFEEELAVLINDSHNAARPAGYTKAQKPYATDEEFYSYQLDYVVSKVQRRLRGRGLIMQKWQIEDALKSVSLSFKARIVKDYGGHDANFFIDEPRPPAKRPGRPPKKKPFKHPNGRVYKTMKLASQADESRSYAALKQWKYREKLKTNSL